MSSRLNDVSPRHAWDVLAEANAMWASCTSGKRRLVWDKQAFMLTGAREVAWIMAHAHGIGAVPDVVECALDFGCGPGRLIEALAAIAPEVIGVDTSHAMLELARANHQGRQAVTFTSDIDEVATASIDVAYSTFVLQHLHEAARRSALSAISRTLRVGGVFIFQFPHHPRMTPYGLPWYILPNKVLMWIQETIYRIPASMPMYWRSFAKLPRELNERGLHLIEKVEGLHYSPNWVDTWHIATRTEDSYIA
jgi:SAM-dependent methyltransferase